MVTNTSVLYLHQYYATPSDAAGVRSYEISRRLQAAGYRVTVFTTDAMRRRKCTGLFSREVVDGVTVVSIRSLYSNRLGTVGRVAWFAVYVLAASVYATFSKYDVAYASSTPLTVAIPAILAEKVRGRPFVFEVRDVWPEIPIALGYLRARVSKAAAHRLAAAAYGSADAVVALSPDMMEVIVARYPFLTAARATVPNGVDPSAIDAHPSDCADCLSLRKALRVAAERGQSCMVYGGTFGYVNDLPYLVRLAAESEGRWSIHLIGDGKQRRSIRCEAARLGVLDDSLHIHAPLPKRCLLASLSQVHLAISTTLDEPALWGNSANKVFDAMAAGTAIAVNHGGWLADSIQRAGAGLLLSRDPRAAAHQLDRASRGGWLAAMGHNSRILGKEFGWDELSAKIADVLQGAVSRGQVDG